MSLQQSSRQLARAARSLRRPQESERLADLRESFPRLCLCHVRSYRPSSLRLASPLDLSAKSSVKDVKDLKESAMTPERRRKVPEERIKWKSDSKEKSSTAEERRVAALSRVKAQQKEDEANAIAQSQQLGGLAPNSFFADSKEKKSDKVNRSLPRAEEAQEIQEPETESEVQLKGPFSTRNLSAMAVALNPRPNARARWQRRMVIRDIRHRGRLPKRILLARTERSHLSRSHFFKTSMKKLAPLARQIAGKSIDEAITQMRFSNKKAARDVRQHLLAARNEAIVARGMGLAPTRDPPSPTSSMEEIEEWDEACRLNPELKAPTASKAASDPSITPPLSTQGPGGSLRSSYQPDPTNDPSRWVKVAPNATDIYIAEAWTNRGPYGREPEYRAKGRVNILRPPYTGLSVLLKEEKTRTREKAEKEMKAIRKRTGKNMWTQLPDRPVVRQSQQLLW